MLKKDITYVDFEGNQVTETFYFNLTKAELLEMESSYEGGLSAAFEKIKAAVIASEILGTFKYIVEKSYGVRTADGKFIKGPRETGTFAATEAYSELLFELLEKPEEGAAFMNGIVPKNVDASKPVAEQTEAEVARARSEASMQGYQKPAPIAKVDPPVEAQAPQPTDEQIAAYLRSQNTQPGSAV